MIQFEKLHYKIGGSYPKNPILRQNRRGKAKVDGDYSQVDLAMREPVRILNEELKIHTFACCEYHPDEVDERQYETFQCKVQKYPFTYCSYISLDLVTLRKVKSLIEFLKSIGFTEDNHPIDSLVDKIENNAVTFRYYYSLHIAIPEGILNFNYSCYQKGEPVDGRPFIEIIPFEEQRIRQWKEWDNIRDTGWEYWLEILYRFTNYGHCP